MPNRMLRDWTDSLRFDNIDAASEQLFVRLLMKADDYGRFHAEPRLVRSMCFPLGGPNESAVAKSISDLSQRGLISTYVAGDRQFLAIVNWGQRFRGSKPKFPQPEGEDAKWLALPTTTTTPSTTSSSSTTTTTTTTTADNGGDTPQPAASGGDLFGDPKDEDEWLNNLRRQFPDRDVDGEFKTFRAYCAKKGTAANRRGFVGWLKKASTAVRGRKERYGY
jgi:hypothetical protein